MIRMTHVLVFLGSLLLLPVVSNAGDDAEHAIAAQAPAATQNETASNASKGRTVQCRQKNAAASAKGRDGTLGSRLFDLVEATCEGCSEHPNRPDKYECCPHDSCASGMAIYAKSDCKFVKCSSVCKSKS